MNPAQLWSEKYAARFETLRALEARLRAEAFLDLPLDLCGVPVRLMTPRHLHLLEGCGNPLVVGGEPLPGHYVQFVWILSLGRESGGWLAPWRRGRLLRRLGRLPAGAVHRECSAYLEQVFLDAPSAAPAPGGAAPRPFGGWFLVPLLTLLAAELGPADPWSGRPWGCLPLPLLFQFRKVLEARARGKDFVDRNPSDKLLSDFAAELNAPKS